MPDRYALVIPNHVGIVHREGCKEIYSFSKHWLCLFPQHGAGPKHKRPIPLEPWQQWIAVEQHPRMLLRGLIHSDGCRALNKVWGGRYEYVRYMFSNRSEDIHRIFAMACDRAGIEWRRSTNGRHRYRNAPQSKRWNSLWERSHR